MTNLASGGRATWIRMAIPMMLFEKIVSIKKLESHLSPFMMAIGMKT